MSFAGGKLLIVGENATAHIFATYPAPYLSLANAFAEQVSVYATKTQLHSGNLENFFANLFQSWCVSDVSIFILSKALQEESWSPSLHFREGSQIFP